MPLVVAAVGQLMLAWLAMPGSPNPVVKPSKKTTSVLYSLLSNWLPSNVGLSSDAVFSPAQAMFGKPY